MVSSRLLPPPPPTSEGATLGAETNKHTDKQQHTQAVGIIFSDPRVVTHHENQICFFRWAR